MALILVYNNAMNRMERYYREEWQPMPYNVGGTLKVREFRGASKSNILWTDRRAMNSWNTFRRFWGSPIFVGYAFKRIWEGGHSSQSQHYAGTAFDLGQTLTATQRTRLRTAATNSGAWSYVEPAYLTPRWVHVDDRFGTPACSIGGFPALSIGSKGVYVLILQDALNALGYTIGLDGIYGRNTSYAVRNFQRAQGLAVLGNVNCATWVRLTTLANGIG
ncbi:MAG: peptidoglycan-binding protein [Clostridiaceae bacterium]|nr:peptidoglycan-binding protein [Clostridiaceae bacterium]